MLAPAVSRADSTHYAQDLNEHWVMSRVARALRILNARHVVYNVTPVLNAKVPIVKFVTKDLHVEGE